MPDYEIKCWNEENFDINSISFVKEACSVRKYGFVVDYLRLHALFTEGGIYLDTDVIVKKRFDDLLFSDFFSAVEYHPSIIKKENTNFLINKDGTVKNLESGVPGIGMLVAIMGSVPGHWFIKECLDFYKNYHFILPNGEYNMKVAPGIYAEIAYKYGFRYKDTIQKLDNGMIFYPSSTLPGDIDNYTDESCAFHYCENSWADVQVKKNFLKKLKGILSKNNYLRKILGKKSYRYKEKTIEIILNEILNNDKTVHNQR